MVGVPIMRQDHKPRPSCGRDPVGTLQLTEPPPPDHVDPHSWVFGHDKRVSRSTMREKAHASGISATDPMPGDLRCGHLPRDVRNLMREDDARRDRALARRAARDKFRGTEPLGDWRYVWHAAQRGDAREIERLLRPYVGTSDYLRVLDAPRPYDGTTPLWIAAAAGRADAVRYLAAHGAHVDAPRDGDAATPLYIAARLGHLDVVQLLVGTFAADLGRAASDGATPLWAACHSGHAPVARALVTHAARAGRGARAAPTSGRSAARGAATLGALMSEKARGYLPHEAAEHQGHKQLTAWLRAFVQQDGAARGGHGGAALGGHGDVDEVKKGWTL